MKGRPNIDPYLGGMSAEAFAAELEGLGLKPKTFARLVPWDDRTVRHWLKMGVTRRTLSALRFHLEAVRVLVTPGGGGEHLTKRGNGRPRVRCRTPHRDLLAAEEARSLLDYDPDTGSLTWKVARNGHPAGDIVRTIVRGYVRLWINGHCYGGHRVAWLLHHGRWPADKLDHIDRNPTNNRLSNLRECSQAQNAANSSINRRNTSGFTGVMRSKNGKKWVAQIMARGKAKRIGTFCTPEEAGAAYRETKRELYGEFAR